MTGESVGTARERAFAHPTVTGIGALMSALLEMRGITKSYGPVHANVNIESDRLGLLDRRPARRKRLGQEHLEMKILFGMVQPDQVPSSSRTRNAARPPREALARPASA